MAIIAPVVATSAVTTFTPLAAGSVDAVTMPAGTAVGDFVAVFFRCQDSSYNAEASLAGFDRHASGALGSPTNRYQAIFVKKITSSGDIPGATVNLTQPGVHSGARCVVIAVRITGVDLSDPIVGVTSALGVLAAGVLSRAGFNSADQALDLFFAGSEFGAGNTHVPIAFPDGFTTIAQTTRPVSGDLAAGRTYGYLGRKISTGPIADNVSIAWTTPSAPAAMGITLRGIGDGGGGDDTYLTPRVVGTPTYVTIAGGASSFAISVPAGVRAGDVLAFGYRTNGTNSPTDYTNDAFDRYGTPFVEYSAEQRVSGLQLHPVTKASEEPAFYTFTKTISDTRTVAAMMIIRDADLDNLVVGESSLWTTSGTTMTIREFPILDAPALLIAMFANEETAGHPSTPAVIPPGFTTQVVQNQLADPASLVGTRTSLWIGTRPIESAGMSGDIVLGWGVNSGNGNSALALAGKIAPPPAPGYPITLGDGRTATAWIVRGGVPLVPASLRGHVGTYPDVDEVLSIHGLTMAHRGGSIDWPEMSQFAFDQSRAAGYRLLEFSAQRSKDGWWFGMHDNNFDRTSGVSGSLPPSFYTQAEIESSFMNVLNSSATPRPYLGLIDFLNRYSTDNILMVDPKNQLGSTTEFLNILDAHGGPDRIIVKYFGVGSGSIALADAATARGYRTWGYFYEANVASGDLAAAQSHWSILGMEWNASPAAWTAAKSYGKKVIGHIIATPEQAATALGRGADILQVSGVSAIPAVSWA